MIRFVNNRGFTLLEALVGIMLMVTLLFLCSMFLHTIKDNLDDNYEENELILFISQIQKDFLEGKSIQVNKKQITIKNYVNERITYRFTGEKLIRQVNGSGQEIALLNADEISFTKDNKVVKVNVVFENGGEYYGYLGTI